MTIFVTTDPETQVSRIKLRNPDKYNMFIEKWIPLEELYFSTLDVEKECDIVYLT